MFFPYFPINTKKSEISELSLWLLQSINNNHYNVDPQEGHFKANRARSVRVQLFTSHTWMVGDFIWECGGGWRINNFKTWIPAGTSSRHMFGQANIFVLGDTDPAYKAGLHEQSSNAKHAFSIIFNTLVFCWKSKNPPWALQGPVYPFRPTVIFLKKYLLSVLGFVLFDLKNTQENHFTLISMACPCVAS